MKFNLKYGSRPFKAVVIILILFISIIFSLFLGPVKIPPLVVTRIFFSQVPFVGNLAHWGFTGVEYDIVVLVREPVILGAVIVGAALAMGGSSVQSVFRNPITEPYIIGISSGATLGAVFALSTQVMWFGAYTLQVLAFSFSIVVMIVIYSISFRSGKVPPMYFLLSGIAISLFLSAIVGLMLFSNKRLESEAFAWLLGSLSGVTWAEDAVVFTIVLISGIVLTSFSKDMDALQMGEHHAQSIGVNVERAKLISLLVTTLGVSAAVSISGLIGFVGLLMPHVSRMLFGGSNRIVIPTSAVLGAIFLLLANDIARDSLSYTEIPVGIITGLVGVPFFMYLLRRISRGGYVT